MGRRSVSAAQFTPEGRVIRRGCVAPEGSYWIAGAYRDGRLLHESEGHDTREAAIAQVRHEAGMVGGRRQ